MFLASITSIDSFVLADRDSSDDGINWMKDCQMAPDFLVSDSRSELVNDDNELTSKEEGFLLCLGGKTVAAILSGDPAMGLGAAGCGSSSASGLTNLLSNLLGN